MALPKILTEGNEEDPVLSVAENGELIDKAGEEE